MPQSGIGNSATTPALNLKTKHQLNCWKSTYTGEEEKEGKKSLRSNFTEMVALGIGRVSLSGFSALYLAAK